MDVAYAGTYRSLWERHWWWRSREAFVRWWLDRLGGPDGFGRILDVGCGDGLFFNVLSQYGRVSGLEPDPSLIQDPRWRDRIQIGTLDADFVPVEAFDLALMLDVLEHIEDDVSALVRLRDALRPGGQLMLTVPAHPWLWSQHDEANEHHRRYTSATLRRVLEASGFQVELIRPFFGWTVAPMLMRKLLAPAGGDLSDYRVTIPPEPVNRLLTGLSKAEHALSRRLRLPCGSSLFALARVPDPAAV